MAIPVIQEGVSLQPYHTFGTDVFTEYFTEVKSVEEVQSLLPELQKLGKPFLWLGGGSNVLFTKDYDGIVIQNQLKGISTWKEDATHIWVRAASGEVWHDLVSHCVAQNWGGIENLSLIPGTVGAAPMQNIGAYGVELVQVFDHLEALNLETLETEIFYKEDCEFGYRESCFKKSKKGQYFILAVTLKLHKNPTVKDFNISYGAIQEVINRDFGGELSVANIAAAVIQIRRSKLPDPKVLGNAGSFFKNPEISLSQYYLLQQEYPNIPGYPVADGIKVPAGWLIEQCGWKGKRVGETGSHKDQALVLVNYGEAEGAAIYQLALDIIESVQERFGIQLSPEVNIIS